MAEGGLAGVKALGIVRRASVSSRAPLAALAGGALVIAGTTLPDARPLAAYVAAYTTATCWRPPRPCSLACAVWLAPSPRGWDAVTGLAADLAPGIAWRGGLGS